MSLQVIIIFTCSIKIQVIVRVKAKLRVRSSSAGDTQVAGGVFRQSDPGSKPIQWFLNVIKAVGVIHGIALSTKLIIIVRVAVVAVMVTIFRESWFVEAISKLKKT